jgi:hypothetical protein
VDFTHATRVLLPGGSLADVSYFGPGFGDVPMSLGALLGDGFGAGHFQEGAGALLDPALLQNEIGMFTAIDLRAFDLIGWDVQAAVVPLPPAVYLFALALGTLVRRRRLGANS